MKYKLSDLCDIQIGRTPPRKESYWFNTGMKSDYTWVSIKDLGECNKYISSSSETISQAGQIKFNIPIVKAGTLLLSFKLTVGRLAIATKDLLTNEAIAQLPIKDVLKVDIDFLYYYLLRFPWSKLGSTSSIATAINSKLIKEMEIELPDIVTQKKIADILSAIDKKIDINNAINNNLEQQAQALFKSWFVDYEPFGGNKPSDWQISTLGEVSDMGAGGDKPHIFSPVKTTDCPFPIYSNGLSNEGLYGYTNAAKIFDESVTVSARGTIGYVCLRHIPYVPIVRLVTLVPHKETLSAKYLYFWLKQLHITGTGTTQQQLTVPAFQKNEILVPNIDTIASFDEIVNSIYQKIWSNQLEIEYLSSIRDTILPRLMSGELDVSDLDL